MSTRPERKKWWTRKGVWYGIAVLAWLAADRLFDYHSPFVLYLLFYLGFIWFVLPWFESWVKRLSLEAVAEALADADPASTMATVQSSLKDLREKLERPDFAPYSVSIGLSYDSLPGLLQTVGVMDGDQWINGVEWGVGDKQREPFKAGIDFVVLSSDQHGNPSLICRTDVAPPEFLKGLVQLGTAIEHLTFKNENVPELLRSFRHHPCLCFGNLLREHDTYQIALEVDETWRDKLQSKPDVECRKEYESTPDWPTKHVYLVLARIPRSAIDAEDPESMTEESIKNRSAQLEQCGWVPDKHEEGLKHRFVWICRDDLRGRSVIGRPIEWGQPDP